MVVLGEEKWIVVVVGNLKEIRYEKVDGTGGIKFI
jgi:hypothetical protein